LAIGGLYLSILTSDIGIKAHKERSPTQRSTDNDYRLSDANVNVTRLVADFADLARLGAGTIELLNYFLYGCLEMNGPNPVDWDIYGFALPIYNDVLIAALQAYEDNGLLLDFEVGVNSSQGVPAESNNPDFHTAWHLSTRLWNPANHLQGLFQAI